MSAGDSHNRMLLECLINDSCSSESRLRTHGCFFIEITFPAGGLWGAVFVCAGMTGSAAFPSFDFLPRMTVSGRLPPFTTTQSCSFVLAVNSRLLADTRPSRLIQNKNSLKNNHRRPLLDVCPKAKSCSDNCFLDADAMAKFKAVS